MEELEESPIFSQYATPIADLEGPTNRRLTVVGIVSLISHFLHHNIVVNNMIS